jgi:hypothetical protein
MKINPTMDVVCNVCDNEFFTTDAMERPHTGVHDAAIMKAAKTPTAADSVVVKTPAYRPNNGISHIPIGNSIIKPLKNRFSDGAPWLILRHTFSKALIALLIAVIPPIYLQAEQANSALVAPGRPVYSTELYCYQHNTILVFVSMLILTMQSCQLKIKTFYQVLTSSL